MHARNIKWILFGLLFFCFPIAQAGLWHVWYTLTNCSVVALNSQARQFDYMRTVSALLGQKEELHAESHVKFNNDRILSYYSRTSPNKSLFCTILPQEKMVKIDVYSPEESFDREKLKDITTAFFDTSESQQTTTYLPE